MTTAGCFTRGPSHRPSSSRPASSAVLPAASNCAMDREGTRDPSPDHPRFAGSLRKPGGAGEAFSGEASAAASGSPTGAVSGAASSRTVSASAGRSHDGGQPAAAHARSAVRACSARRRARCGRADGGVTSDFKTQRFYFTVLHSGGPMARMHASRGTPRSSTRRPCGYDSAGFHLRHRIPSSSTSG